MRRTRRQALRLTMLPALFPTASVSAQAESSPELAAPPQERAYTSPIWYEPQG